jgi:hypothetical protein
MLYIMIINIINIYNMSEAMVFHEAQNLLYFASISWFWKFKWLIQTVEYDLFIEIYLEIKFYIFLKVFAIF